jgi:hypothetical protein
VNSQKRYFFLAKGKIKERRQAFSLINQKVAERKQV